MKHLIMALLAAGLAANAQTSTTSVSTETQQTNESSAKIQDLQKKDEQMKDIDEEITNARMRASLGSKSKWSIRTALNYQGGSIEKPFDEERPNYLESVATEDIAYFSGDIAIKRRLGEMDSLNAGTGLRINKPFHRTFDEATNSGDGRRNLNVSNPYLEYNIAYKVGDYQMSTSATYTYISNRYLDEVVGMDGGIDVSQMLIKEVGTKLSVGTSLVLSTYLYENANDVTDAGEKRTNMDVGLYPFMEYAFNDRYSFRTVFGYFSFSEYKTEEGRFRQTEPYQSVGLGISLARDFYLYPNLQFAPKDLRADRTNVGLSANINLF